MENLAYDYQCGEESKYEIIDGKIYGEPRYEIIGGEKFIMSPAPNITHGIIVNRLASIFRNYVDNEDLQVEVFGDNVDVFLSDETHYMPDVSIVCNLELIRNGKKILGAPDLVVEVLSESTMKNDLGKKKDSYEKYGVKEYWIVDPWAKRIEVYHLINENFALDDIYKIPLDDDYQTKMEIKVSIFDDLVVDIRKIFKNWINN